MCQSWTYCGVGIYISSSHGPSCNRVCSAVTSTATCPYMIHFACPQECPTSLTVSVCVCTRGPPLALSQIDRDGWMHLQVDREREEEVYCTPAIGSNRHTQASRQVLTHAHTSLHPSRPSISQPASQPVASPSLLVCLVDWSCSLLVASSPLHLDGLGGPLVDGGVGAAHPGLGRRTRPHCRQRAEASLLSS